jgi:hypothetical protein
MLTTSGLYKHASESREQHVCEDESTYDSHNITDTIDPGRRRSDLLETRHLHHICRRATIYCRTQKSHHITTQSAGSVLL